MVQEAGQLSKLKAVLSTKFCNNVQEAIELAEQLDHYYLEQRLHDPIEIAEQEIRDYIPSNKADALLKNVNLYNYGMEVMREHGSKLTEYGLVIPDET